MRVFRVQRDCGQGPFGVSGGPGSDVFARALGDEGFYYRLPCPDTDGINFRKGVHLCAVATVRHLVRWFPRRARQALHERAYKLFEFDVPDDKVLRGGLQVMFDPSEAQLIESRPLIAA